MMILTVLGAWMSAMALDLTKATIVYQKGDAPLVKQMAQVLADDIERVSGIKPQVSTQRSNGTNVVIGTVRYTNNTGS